MFHKYLILLLTFLITLNSYKILIVNPKFGYSHVNFFSQIADILTEAGHNVTVLAINMDPTITHPGAYKANVVTFPASKEIEDIFAQNIAGNFLWNLTSSGIEQYEVFKRFMNATYLQSLKVFNNEELTEKIKKEKFDLGITEMLNEYIFGMFKIWGIKAYVSGLSTSLGEYYYNPFGVPFPASFIPCLMSPFSDKMTYLERFQNLLSYNIGKMFYSYYGEYLSLQSEFDAKYGVGFFNGYKALGDSSFLIINSNPFLDFPSPKTSKMVEVSGIGIKDSKPLSDYWNKILSLRNKTIMISFGTFAKTIYMPKNIKDGLLEAIRKLNNITFILKYEKPEDGTGKNINNLIISKWLPQSDLLNDERLSLFITHGGMGSTTELSFKGVPAIAIPLLGDQFRNIKLLERQKTAIIMNKLDLKNPDILIKNIKKILEDDTYKNNAKLVSRRLNKRPVGSKKLLIEHIEFAAEFGNLDILDLASRNMGVIEYYNLDIIIPITLGSLSICLLLMYITFKYIKKIPISKVKKD
uniref:glucuronosyltransferase n=1 Tax=Strongyloides stercoralis TaxID=6248 RepID=A0A0K0DWJ7_STRER